MSDNIIDFGKKRESRDFLKETKNKLRYFEEQVRLDPSKAPAFVAEISKLIHRIELLQLTIERGYDPKEFLIIPE